MFLHSETLNYQVISHGNPIKSRFQNGWSTLFAGEHCGFSGFCDGRKNTSPHVSNWRKKIGCIHPNDHPFTSIKPRTIPTFFTLRTSYLTHGSSKWTAAGNSGARFASPRDVSLADAAAFSSFFFERQEMDDLDRHWSECLLSKWMFYWI